MYRVGVLTTLSRDLKGVSTFVYLLPGEIVVISAALCWSIRSQNVSYTSPRIMVQSKLHPGLDPGPTHYKEGHDLLLCNFFCIMYKKNPELAPPSCTPVTSRAAVLIQNLCPG
ncbi:hypothetical protein GDO81_027065 [Engystomops pustulosus]|uniref:Uncharacterized protein n=1 Tax=Engystomops pustulosus TaxID=76066 RepID=A0AAV6YKE9_ENGPU|nr:hypothetical protein GDO81_027065 [Engystomops pustulosus]